MSTIPGSVHQALSSSAEVSVAKTTIVSRAPQETVENLLGILYARTFKWLNCCFFLFRLFGSVSWFCNRDNNIRVCVDPDRGFYQHTGSVLCMRCHT